MERLALCVAAMILFPTSLAAEAPCPVPDTMQDTCYSVTDAIDCPAEGGAFYGQDAQIATTQASYTDNGDGTATDNVTGLMWAKTPDINGDGDGEILANDKLSFKAALAGAESFDLAGHDDWRLPTIKELQGIVDYTRAPDITDSPALDRVFESTEITNEVGQVEWGWIWSSTPCKSLLIGPAARELKALRSCAVSPPDAAVRPMRAVRPVLTYREARLLARLMGIVPAQLPASAPAWLIAA